LWNPKAQRDMKIWASESFGYRLNLNRPQTAYDCEYHGSVQNMVAKIVKSTLPHYDAACGDRWPVKSLLIECNYNADQAYLSTLVS